jgi:hypothetical protein
MEKGKVRFIRRGGKVIPIKVESRIPALEESTVTAFKGALVGGIALAAGDDLQKSSKQFKITAPRLNLGYKINKLAKLKNTFNKKVGGQSLFISRSTVGTGIKAFGVGMVGAAFLSAAMNDRLAKVLDKKAFKGGKK